MQVPTTSVYLVIQDGALIIILDKPAAEKLWLTPSLAYVQDLVHFQKPDGHAQPKISLD